MNAHSASLPPDIIENGLQEDLQEVQCLFVAVLAAMNKRKAYCFVPLTTEDHDCSMSAMLYMNTRDLVLFFKALNIIKKGPQNSLYMNPKGWSSILGQAGNTMKPNRTFINDLPFIVLA